MTTATTVTTTTSPRSHHRPRRDIAEILASRDPGHEDSARVARRGRGAQPQAPLARAFALAATSGRRSGGTVVGGWRRGGSVASSSAVASARSDDRGSNAVLGRRGRLLDAAHLADVLARGRRRLLLGRRWLEPPEGRDVPAHETLLVAGTTLAGRVDSAGSSGRRGRPRRRRTCRPPRAPRPRCRCARGCASRSGLPRWRRRRSCAAASPSGASTRGTPRSRTARRRGRRSRARG